MAIRFLGKSSVNLHEVISASPTLFPLNLDATGQRVQVIRMLEQDYSAASFLDNRLLAPHVQHATIDWPEFEQASRNLPLACDFIFHVSHCGSTLLSRLLGSDPNCLSLREPAILRLFGRGQYLDRMKLFLGLWSRTFYPQQRTSIKATSFVNEIASDLLRMVTDSRAILMYVPVTTFLPGLLDGAMTDIVQEASFRLARVQKRGFLVGLNVSDLSAGQCVAMNWLAEMISLAETARTFPERILWVDFDQFLDQPESQLNRCLNHFRLTADAVTILSGSMMQRYAKKPEVQYDSSFRAKLLEQSAKKYQSEIARGLDWLHQSEPSRAMQHFGIQLN
jgi:hypothetical protein